MHGAIVSHPTVLTVLANFLRLGPTDIHFTYVLCSIGSIIHTKHLGLIKGS